MTAPKGNAFLRWAYARWIQILALFGLQGADGRPSATKLACTFGLICGCVMQETTLAIISLCGMFGRPTLVAAIGSWRGTTASVNTRSTVNVNVRQERDTELGIDPA